MITGSSELERIQRQSSRPSVPGSITSSTTRSGSERSSASRAASPSAGLERPVPLALEVADDDLAHDRLVVDDEDGCHGRNCAQPIVAPG